MNDVVTDDRDWVDIIGTGLVIAAALAAVLLVIGGWIWSVDRRDERRSVERLECLERGWLWVDDRCLPAAVIGVGVEDEL